MNKSCFALLLLAATAPAQAEDLIHWWDVSGTFLYGDDYDLAPSANQTTLTFETAGGWKYGDWFMFQDVTYYNGDNFGVTSTTYGEISPRFSLGKMTGRDFKFGPVKDVLIALTYEEGEGPVQSFLYGVGLDLAIPGFTYFSLNTYKRDAISTGNISDGWQVTPAFRIDFPIGNANFVLDGFMDWVFSADNAGYDENIHFNPQLKFDLGKALFGDKRANKLYVGIEYDYWKSKYGVDGIDQSTYSVIAKYHF
jgi:nucleoside-specific outer membrane channel protein Tsx